MNNKKFWLVWNPAGGLPRYRHESEKSAQVEAERLARTNRGQSFYVLEANSMFVVDDLKRVDFVSPEQPPF